jgi:hypothetical protein
MAVAAAAAMVATATETVTAIEMATVKAKTLMPTPSALPLNQFLLRPLLLLSRVLIYSSSCCTFRRPLSLIMLSAHQQDGFAPVVVALMSQCQLSQVQDADINVGIKCICLASSTLGGVQLPCLFLQ